MCIIKMDFSLSNTYMVLCAVSFSQTYGSSYFIRVFAFVTLCLRRDSKWRTIKVNFPGKLARNCCRRQATYALPTELPFPSSSSFADISITRPHPWYSKRQGFHYLFFCPPTFLLREISPHLPPTAFDGYKRKAIWRMRLAALKNPATFSCFRFKSRVYLSCFEYVCQSMT